MNDVVEEQLPWAKGLFGPRCRAVKEPNRSGYWGRCDLAPHSELIDHALERGMDTPRWSTRWSDV